MKNLLNDYLKEFISDDFINEKFDYKFDNKSQNAFEIEFKKLLNLMSFAIYDKQNILTLINSNDFIIEINDLNHIFELYNYSSENNLTNENVIILEFLTTYWQSINSREFKSKYKDFQKTINEFKTIANKYNFLKELNLQKKGELYEFYKDLITYGIDEDIYIGGNIINRIFNVLEFLNIDTSELIEIFIKNNKNLVNIICFDTNKKMHLENYKNAIRENIKHFCGYSCSKELLIELEKDKVLEKSFLTDIVNCYIEYINEIGVNLSNKTGKILQEISDIEHIKNELNYVIEHIESLSKIQKEKLKECIRVLFTIKRILISDREHINKDMIEHEYEIKIEAATMKKMKETLENNVFTLYSASKVDFCKEIENALEIYSKFPLQSIATRYNFNSNNQVYNVNIEELKCNDDQDIRNKFNELGLAYTEKNKESLINIIGGNYYEELLKYLSKTFFMQQSFIIATLKEDGFEKMIKDLNKQFGEVPENYYIMIVYNILGIEYHVRNMLELHNLNVTDNGQKNLNNLFEYFKNDTDCVNGLMYLNYILYEKAGLNLRNNVLHGNLLGDDLKIPLLVTFAGLIFMNWMFYEKK